ncbi:MAG: hypothetical protein GY788_15065 [bacterium]|nr:hypothetical protein [bacterium]
MVEGLPEPLRELVAAGEWEGEGQLRDGRIPVEVAQRWDPDSSWINLWTPITLSDEVAGNRAFWGEFGALSTINTDDYAIIGDFGPGSDSPLVVALGKQPAHVMRLAWSTSGDGNTTTNRWEVIADDFDSFLVSIFPNGPAKGIDREA